MIHSAVYARNRRDLTGGNGVAKHIDKDLTVAAVAKLLDCGKSHVYNLIDEKKLQAIRIGQRKGYRVKESEVDRFKAVSIVCD